MRAGTDMCRPVPHRSMEKGNSLYKNLDRRVHQLRGAVWLSYVLHESGLSAAGFADEHLYKSRSRSGLAAKWKRGEVAPSKQTAQRIDAHIPGSAAVFNHPIFELLRGVPITDGRIWMLLSALPSVPRSVAGPRKIKASERRHLSELRPERLRWNDRPVSTPFWVPPDSWQLRCKPSFDNLANMIGLVRVAEDPRYLAEHFYWSMDVFRFVPSCLQQTWLIPYLDQFVDLLEALCAQILICTSAYFTIDRAMLKEQLGWKEFRPLYVDGDRRYDPIHLTALGKERARDLLAHHSERMKRLI